MWYNNRTGKDGTEKCVFLSSLSEIIVYTPDESTNFITNLQIG